MKPYGRWLSRSSSCWSFGIGRRGCKKVSSGPQRLMHGGRQLPLVLGPFLQLEDPLAPD